MPTRKGSTTKEEVPLVDLQARAAWLYYVEGLTQLQISRVMDTSRAKVIRLLASARDSGIVRIRIQGEGSDHIALCSRLIDRYRLHKAGVVPPPFSERDAQK